MELVVCRTPSQLTERAADVIVESLAARGATLARSAASRSRCMTA